MQVGLRWVMEMIVLDEKWMTFHILPLVFSLINFVLNINNMFLMFNHLVNFANECKHIHKLAQACKSAFKHSF